MRNIPAAIEAKAAVGASTLVRCWRVTRADGKIYGFTEHDRPVSIMGMTFEAESGLSATDAARELGFGVANQEIAGGLSSDAITEADIAAGLWDNARVEVFLVDWETGDYIADFVGRTGRMTRSETVFTAEIDGPQRAARIPRGRVYHRHCDAVLGDQRCGVDLSLAAYSSDAQVVSVDGATSVTVYGLDGYSDGWFDYGTLAWKSGANQGMTATVRIHQIVGDDAFIDIWEPPRSPILAGDTLTIFAGCDKSGRHCRNKFNNYTRFRGFETMPGDSAVITAPDEKQKRDGSSRYDFD
ncbi:DUF2163 domain-containing protein [Roseovarius sp. SYSU LYC5161]|uniref:DUF2163 domain-containing protein n=1 Tax=Roseovarius halophilus (ex Wu et al. 2025) TaxID=3376060 RepID=UPI00399BEC25